MPRPPILPAIDWRTVFASGRDFAAWLDIADHSHYRDAMAENAGRLALPAELEAPLVSLQRTVHVLAIAEDWCGDVVRHVPALARMERATPHLHVRFVSRAQHPDVFVRYLTNGGEAIPKFIFFNDQFVECGNWGPMQADCREIIARGKAAGNIGAARARVSQIYEADPHLRQVFLELLHLVDIATSN